MKTIYGEQTPEEVEQIVAELDTLRRSQLYRLLKEKWSIENTRGWLDKFEKRDVILCLLTGRI